MEFNKIISIYKKGKRRLLSLILGILTLLSTESSHGASSSHSLRLQIEEAQGVIIENAKHSLAELSRAQKIQIESLQNLLRNSKVPLIVLTSTLENIPTRFPDPTQSDPLSTDNPSSISGVLERSLRGTGLKLISVGYKVISSVGLDFDVKDEEQINEFAHYEFSYFIIPEDLDVLTQNITEFIHCQEATEKIQEMITENYKTIVDKITKANFNQNSQMAQLFHKALQNNPLQQESLLSCLN